MGSVPFAFSVHSFVNSVGADAGFAAIIGLAILVLLYFAQARETAGLREQAYESAQRVDQLEARLSQLARQSAAATEAPEAGAPAVAAAPATSVAAAPAAARARVPAVAVAAMVGAPAGVAAPALAAATRMIPVAVPQAAGVGSVRDGQSVGATPAGAPVPATAAAAHVGGAAGTGVGGIAGSGGVVGSAGVAGAGGGGTNGIARDRIAAASAPGAVRNAGGPGAATPAGARGAPASVGARTAGPPQRPPGRPPAPPDGQRRPVVPPTIKPPRRSRIGRVLAVLAGLVAVAAVVGGLLLLTSGTDGSGSTTNASRTTNAPGAATTHRLVSFNPAKVTVAVLNGTASPGLAGRTSRRLSGAGYKAGMVATATDQTHAGTVVAFLPGYRTDAVRVAGTLKLPMSSVQSIDATARAVACPPPSQCTANVVVTAGADLASS